MTYYFFKPFDTTLFYFLLKYQVRNPFMSRYSGGRWNDLSRSSLSILEIIGTFETVKYTVT